MSQQVNSPWPHRLAILLACVTFPLIWVGGLVTTYDAGMAVPDWPGTYGYNLFLYPWQTWLFGPWDLFIEHGHRLLGSLAGLLNIAVVVAAFRTDSRKWFRWYTVAALVAVIAQGGLGGARVLLDQRLLAMVHGCVAPLYFVSCIGMIVFTSRWWRESPDVRRISAARWVHTIAFATVLLAYVQLVFGAYLRHIPVTASVGAFSLVVYLHLIFAGLVTFHIVWIAWLCLFGQAAHPGLKRPALTLGLLIDCQLLLGVATWVVNYMWPGWAPDLIRITSYTTIHAKGLGQMLTVTAHVATGSLILGVAALLALRSLRLIQFAPVVESVGQAEEAVA